MKKEDRNQTYYGIEKYLPLLWFSLLIFAFFWVCIVYRSYIWPVFFAILLFIIARPLHQFLNKKMPKWPALNATIATLACIICIILPFTFIVQSLVTEAIILSENLAQYFTDDRIFELIISIPYLTDYFTKDDFWWVSLPAKYQEILGEYSKYLELKNISSILEKTGSFLLGSLTIPLKILTNFLLMTIILLFLFKDSKRFVNFFYAALPFPDWMEKKVVHKFTKDVTAVLKGNFLVAILQGFFVGLAFFISGIGSPFLWGAVGSMVAVIPIVGTGIVFIPVLFI